MSRQEHLQWCKDRAIQVLESGDVTEAWASMVSDLGKHEETKNHAGITLGSMLLFAGQLKTEQKMKEFILGFN